MARSNGATADLYREPINWRKAARIGVPLVTGLGVLTFIGINSMKGDKTETVVREPAAHVYSGPVEGTVPEGSPIVAKYDPSNINHVASVFVNYVREGDRRGLRDVTLGNISNYGILERDGFEGFEIAKVSELTLGQRRKELLTNEYGMSIEKLASVSLGLRFGDMDDLTGAKLQMVYSDEKKSWYVIDAF